MNRSRSAAAEGRIRAWSLPPAPTAWRRGGRLAAVIALLFVARVQADSAPTPAPPADPTEQVRHVLVLNSYHAGLDWTDDQVTGIRSALARHDEEVEVHAEYMDTKRRLDPEQIEAFRVFLRRKYAAHPPDLVVTTDDNAYQFLLEHRDELFPGVPAVFCGVNHFDPAQLRNRKNITGLAERLDLEGNFRLAMRLHPDAREVVVVTDSSATGRGNRREIESLLQRVEFPVPVRLLAADRELTLDEMLDRLSDLPSDSVIHLVDFFRDREGRFIDPPDLLREMRAHTDNPIYGTGTFYMGHGIVGGRLNVAEAIGEAAGERAVRILAGERADDIPVAPNSPTTVVFDWRELARHGIDLGRLPEGSAILYRPDTFYAKYWRLVWAAGAVFAGLCAMIVALLATLGIRRAATRRLRENEERLEAFFSQAADGLCVCDLDGRIERVNNTACRMLGYAESELLGMNLSDIDADVAAAGSARAYFRDLSKRESLTFESRHRRKDGTHCPVEVNVTFIDTSDGPRGLAIARDISKRREYEEQLKAERDLIERMMETSPAGITRVDADGRVIYANRRAEEILGLELSDDEQRAYNDPAWKIADFAGRPFPKERLPFEIVTRTKQPVYGVRHAVEWPDGRRVLLSINAAPLLGADGAFEGMIAALEDITDRWQAEQRYQMLFDLMLDGFALHEIVCDDAGRPVDYRFLAVNPAFERLTGLSADDLVGRTVLEAMPGTEPHWIETYGRVALTGEPTSFEDYSGEIDRHFQVTAFRPAPLQFACIFVDVTDRVRAERELMRSQRAISLSNRIANIFLTEPSEDLYADVLDAVREALGSRFGFFGYINEGGDLVCPSMTRDVWDKCEVPDKSIVFPRNGWGGLWGRSLLEKRTFVANEGLAPPEGHVRLENALAVPILHHGELIGQFAVANRPGGYGDEERELLESAAAQTAPVLHALLEKSRHEAAEERLETQLRQAQKMEAIGQLTGGVAHDFNNLLQVINGAAELALIDTEDGHPARESIAEVAEAGDKAARLVEQLLLFSRRQIMRPVSLDLNETVADLLKMIRRVIGEHIRVEWVPGRRLGAVFADRGMIEQALMNLCVNARDAMPDGGTLTIETRDVEIDDAYCATHSWAEPGRYALLSVTDTGFGIPSDIIEHIFEPFFTTKETGRGTGLGLATVYGVVKQHGGMVNVYSEPDHGSVFKLYWPVGGEEAGGAEARAEDAVAGGGSETILLAEDDESVRGLASRILERAGYTVLTAHNGDEAVARFRRQMDAIDLALLDVVMPRMGGREAGERMRALKPGLKVIFASGYSENAVHTNFVLEEGLTLIQKPFARDTLLRTVRAALDGAGT